MIKKRIEHFSRFKYIVYISMLDFEIHGGLIGLLVKSQLPKT